MERLLRPTSALLFTLAFSACGGEEATRILVRWTTTESTALAPPGEGPDRRILLAERDGGQLRTLDAVTGKALEGPYPLFPSLHAPVAVGSEVVLVSSIGRIVRANLAGESLASPNLALGRTGPPVVAPTGEVWVAATSGRVVSVRGEVLVADATLTGAAETAPAVASDGTAYVATDTGSLVGLSGAGAQVFSAEVPAPASGPSVSASRVAVGALDGVVVYERSGATAFKVPRAARVTGTLFVGDELLAYGEDGKLERYDHAGALISSYSAGPPIYGPVRAMPSGKIALVDSTGKLHRVDREGAAEILDLGGEVGRQAAVTELGWLVLSVGNEVRAIDLEAAAE